jgi:hypothetical protein
MRHHRHPTPLRPAGVAKPGKLLSEPCRVRLQRPDHPGTEKIHNRQPLQTMERPASAQWDYADNASPYPNA